MDGPAAGADNDGSDTGNDTLIVRSLPASVSVTLQGGAGNDLFLLESDAANTPADGSVETILGLVVVSPAADEATGTDTLNIIDTDDATGDTVLITSTTIDGITGRNNGGDNDITYGGSGAIEAISIWTSNNATNGEDTINVQSTQSGSVYTIDTQADDDTVNIGSNAPTLTNSILDNIDGQVDINTGLGTDSLNISDQGDTAGDTYTLGVAAGVTALTFIDGDATSDIRYDVSGAGQLENFTLIGSDDANSVDNFVINATSATTSNLIQDGDDDSVVTAGDNSTFTIQANALAAATNTFQGFDGVDVFNLNFAANLSIAGGASLTIDGGTQLAGNANRDRVNINTAAVGESRALSIGVTYDNATSGDVRVSGLGTATTIDVNTIEQLVYTGDSTNNDLLTVTGTTGDDVVSVTPLSSSAANVFRGGAPFLSVAAAAPFNSPGTNDPGVAGGGVAGALDSSGPDLNLNGLVTGQSNGLTIVGGTGQNRLVVNAPTENDSGADGSAAWDATLEGGIGSVVTTVDGQGYDIIAATQSSVDIRNANFAGAAPFDLVRVNVSTGFTGTVDEDIVINTGEEADPATLTPAQVVADDVTVTLSTTLGFQINGGAPTLGTGALSGDRLNITALPGGTIDIYSDLTSPPNVSIESTGTGGASQPVNSNNIELTSLSPGTINGIVNIIGDNNTATAQVDEYLIFGADVDSAVTGGDADGANEFRLLINGSSPIDLRSVGFLNITGAGGDASAGPGLVNSTICAISMATGAPRRSSAMKQSRGDGMRKELKDAKKPIQLFQFHRLDEALAIESAPYFSMEAIGHTGGPEMQDEGFPIRLDQFADLDNDGREDLITITPRLLDLPGAQDPHHQTDRDRRRLPCLRPAAGRQFRAGARSRSVGES